MSEAVEGLCACSLEDAGGTLQKALSDQVMRVAEIHPGHGVMSHTRVQPESSPGPLAMPSGARGGQMEVRPSSVGVLHVP